MSSRLTPNYYFSAILCTLCFAVFLGYLYSGVEVPLINMTSFILAWTAWGGFFSIVFLLISFFPRKTEGYSYNAFILLTISVLATVSGYILFVEVREGFTAMMSFSLYTLGGPVWLLVFAWIFHLSSCSELNSREA